VPFAVGSALLLAAIVPVLLARRTAPRIERAFDSSVISVVRAAPAIFAAAFVFGAVDAGMAGLIPVYAMREGYTEAHAALCVTAMALGSIVFQYPIGALADRMRKRNLLALCTATGIVGAVLTPFAAHSPLLLYLVLFVWGGLILGVYSIGLTMLGQRFEDSELANANAAFVILYSLGLLAGPLGEGVALDAWNPHGLMLALGLICAGYVGFLVARAPATR
jgi:MFS family permease